MASDPLNVHVDRVEQLLDECVEIVLRAKKQPLQLRHRLRNRLGSDLLDDGRNQSLVVLRSVLDFECADFGGERRRADH